MMRQLTRRCVPALALVIAAGALSGTANAQGFGPPRQPDYDAFYELGPDSLVRRGVPKGEILGPFSLETDIYPGAAQDYWIYVPAQYDGETEVSLMLFNDGPVYMQPDGYYRAVNVLDNLIYRGDIPVMIAAFVDPASMIADGRSIRQQQYDLLNDDYARLIVDHLLPRLYADYNISRDPDRHGFAGWSSGAIAAFTVAWQRPDHFRKLLSGIGTYVDMLSGRDYAEPGMPAGHNYADIVASSEPKPLRIFMIDGRNDSRGLNNDDEYNPDRDWFYQNVRLKDALVAKGYDVNYSWGMGVHSHDMGGAMLPEMMRWLWRDQPVSVDPNDMTERSFRAAAD